MDYHNPTLQSLLRALVSGHDISSLFNSFQREQLHHVGWEILQGVDKAELTSETSAWSVSSNTHSKAVSPLRELLTDIGMKTGVNDNRVSLDLPRPEGHILAGLLGEVIMQSHDVLTRRFCKSLESPLMLTLAKLYQVPSSHYVSREATESPGEADF